MRVSGTPRVRATGEPFALGRRHGEARAASLHAFLDDSLARVNRILPEPVSMDGLRPLLRAHEREIVRTLPDLAAEIDGLAEGAGIEREQALLLQLRREILG